MKRPVDGMNVQPMKEEFQSIMERLWEFGQLPEDPSRRYTREALGLRAAELWREMVFRGVEFKD